MTKLFLAWLFLIPATGAFAAKPVLRKQFIGSGTIEAVMTFEGRVRLDAAAGRARGFESEQIDRQLRYLFGWMTEGPVPAAPRGDHKITRVRVAREDARALTIDYVYEGTVVVKRNTGDEFRIVLPANPDTVYAQSLKNGFNTCGDPDYQDPEDFWHGFNPRRRGCALREGDGYFAFSAKLRPLTTKKISFPEYERLADRDGRIVISFLMGMDNGANLRDPMISRDLNANNFRAIRRSLIGNGYGPRLLAPSEIRRIVPAPVPRAAMPYVEELTKTVHQAGTNREFAIVVRMFYGQTGADEESVAFHWFLKDALENSAVVIYDGHSGVGAHLDLPSIEIRRGFRILPPQDRYQIYFFNSCSSYTHYNTMFFGRKITPRDPRGSKNLDIITTGLGTYFSASHDSNMALIGAIESWSAGRARFNYQQLIRDIDSKNLAGINGDQDNPTR